MSPHNVIGLEGATFPIKGGDICLLWERFECDHYRYTVVP